MHCRSIDSTACPAIIIERHGKCRKSSKGRSNESCLVLSASCNTAMTSLCLAHYTKSLLILSLASNVTDVITCSRMFGDFCSSFFLSPNIFLKDVLPSWLIQASFDRQFDAPNFCRARLGSKTIVEALADLRVSHNKSPNLSCSLSWNSWV